MNPKQIHRVLTLRTFNYIVNESFTVVSIKYDKSIHKKFEINLNGSQKDHTKNICELNIFSKECMFSIKCQSLRCLISAIPCSMHF